MHKAAVDAKHFKPDLEAYVKFDIMAGQACFRHIAGVQYVAENVSIIMIELYII